MPTAAECLAFWNEQNAKGINALDGRIEAIEKKWPAEADQMAYYGWSMKRADDEYAQEMIPIEPEDLKTMIATMNYNNDIDRGKLVTAVERIVVPWLPVGSYQNGGVYRILPGAYGLQPDQPGPKTDRMLVSTNVLGVNTNIQPKIPLRSRKANLSERSTKSNESDDLEIAGFVFHQIGTLQYRGDEVENFQSLEDAARGPWLATGFGVVVRFGRSGAANGIYIIYDFYPEDEWGERNLKLDDDEYWGRLPKDRTHQQFSMAKIADTITELRFGRMFTLTEVLDYPVEIVRAVKTPEDAIIRVTIA
jgi:hypothetical protein